MELMSIGKFAKKVGVNIATLRRMDASGDLKPYHVSKGGTRYYSTEQLKYFGDTQQKAKLVAGYCRVSTPSQKDELENQVNNVKTYMIAKGYSFEMITDIGSGIDYKRQGLKKLIDKINNQEISKIVILYKDRLVGFGYELIEYLCFINNIEIEIIDHTETSKEKELTDDLIQIITVFANRLYGQRSKKTKRLIHEVKNNANSD
ncbi:IS607 family transposase [Enterococcus cecorum]|uniref:IS607 family transposase n=1 Tax=Enterococcus cecorum TaxID=44008 RepID=UPI0006416520|nr:IS607 family transposase [Enterococcus cecorum]HCO28954.1 IS607 family transposase [Lachnospiraceae bacterium]KLN91467.1 transposase [Enterococcus cecorum]KLN92485.1 transposase [Enterococcus cecorum]MCJ0522556.1 IS607 family transposase [Enterococcus cecorum]MCJ0560725.1 IS607 family transposase [Enterococcus cecorum]